MEMCAIGHEMCANNEHDEENHVSTSNSSHDNAYSGTCNSHLSICNLLMTEFQNLNPKGMKFGHININSLSVKMDEFRHMYSCIFDVICVNETTCNESVNESEIVLPGYN